MKKLKLDESNFQAARDYLQQQMERQSWWPREQPHLAKEEFLLMQGSPEALNAWCEKWLFSDQWRQMGNAISRASRNSENLA